MERFDNLRSSAIDSLMTDPEGFTYLDINEDDSPVAIDSMVSLQNGKLMFVTSVKIGTLAGLLETEDPRLNLEQRRQRKPDHTRIPKMAEYLHGSPWAYSAITVALSGSFQFIPTKRPDGGTTRLGILRIPRGYKTRTVIIDGQHRFLSLRAALGLESNYSRYALPYEKQQILAEENIAVIFYVFMNDEDGVEWSQQYFHDLNCLGVSTSRSLGIKFDKRTPINRLAVRLSERAVPFVGRIELEERQCTANNPKLFTLSALRNANKYLLDDITDENLVEKYDKALLYWNRVGAVFTDWTDMPGNEIRNKYIHGFGVILSSLGLLGKYILEQYGDDYEELLQKLKGIDWSRWHITSDGVVKTTSEGKKIGNPIWHGFAMNGASIQNTTSNIRYTSFFLRKKLGLQLSDDEKTELSALEINNA